MVMGYEINGQCMNSMATHDNGLSNNRNMVPEVLEKSAGMSSMMRMADGDGLQWIGHMNSIAAQVASSRKLPVKKERESNKRGRATKVRKLRQMARWCGKCICGHYKKPEKHSHYHRVPWNVTTMRQ
jgi:hypothetical protein